MKSSSMFVPGFCAGVLMVLVALAFAVGAAAKDRPLHEARGVAQANDASTGFTIVYHPTATPIPHQFAAVDLSVAQPAATKSVPATPVSSASPTQAISSPSPTPVSPCDILATSTITNGFSFSRVANNCSVTNTLLADVFTGTKCPIERNSCPYSYLAGNLAPGIVFQREEAPPLDEEDQLMHPAMLQPLARLQKKVFDEWDGRYLLAVVDAYESSSKLGDEIDWPADRQGQLVVLSLLPETATFDTDIGRLCALALGAEFDWVGRRGTNCLAAKRAPPLCNVCRATATAASAPIETLTVTPTLTATLVTTVTVPILTPESPSTAPPPEQPPPTRTSPTPMP